jgi:hypothetical protein
MSSTGQATSSTDNVQLIIGALADYAKETGIDLSKNPFATNLEQSNSPGVDGLVGARRPWWPLLNSR